MEDFYEGQIFEDVYPEEAVKWCNDGQEFHIEEEFPGSWHSETRRFIIVKNDTLPEPED